jgi:hypothetical protein
MCEEEYELRIGESYLKFVFILITFILYKYHEYETLVKEYFYATLIRINTQFLYSDTFNKKAASPGLPREDGFNIFYFQCITSNLPERQQPVQLAHGKANNLHSPSQHYRRT